MKHVYGIVPSRRLGRSLGVSTIPFKTCNYSCIYCQLGRTENMTNSRKTFFNPEDILVEAKTFIETFGEDTFDVVSFVGEGEPTLYTPLDEVAAGIMKLTGKPLVLITNGALLYEAKVREEAGTFDIVMPTLDAWDEESFKRINRPFGKLRYEKIFDGLIEFSKEFEGEIWLEIMLIKGYNDCDPALEKIKQRVEKLKPERVYINVPVRPPAEARVEIPERSRITKARELFRAESIEKLSRAPFSSAEIDGEKATLEIIKRHPMSREEVYDLLASQFSFSPARIEVFLEREEKRARIEKLTHGGKTFYRYSPLSGKKP